MVEEYKIYILKKANKDKENSSSFTIDDFEDIK